MNEQNCSLLQQSGTPKAKSYLKDRRAVAKYREELGIPSSSARRRVE